MVDLGDRLVIRDVNVVRASSDCTDRTCLAGPVDVAVEAGVITGVSSSQAPNENEDADIVDGAGMIALPGMVNAHMHSSESFLSGRYERLPLELWSLYAYPMLGFNERPSERTLRIRTRFTALQLIQNGVTTVVDDLTECFTQSVDDILIVADEYERAGLTAYISGHIFDRQFYDTIPDIWSKMPEDLRLSLLNSPPRSLDQYIDHCERCNEAITAHYGNVHYMVAPSAPHRCSDEALRFCGAFSMQHQTPLQTHVLESRLQAADKRDRRTPLVKLLEAGCLTDRTLLVHCVWLDEDAIGLVAESGASVVHCVASNLKLGSGLAPVRRYLDAGINVTLGTDGASSNDTLSILDAARLTTLVHSAGSPNYEEWISASEAFEMATANGASALGRRGGVLAEGMDADIIIVDPARDSHFIGNDPVRQFVHRNDVSGISTVISKGRLLKKDGRVRSVDVGNILELFENHWREDSKKWSALERQNEDLRPLIEAAYEKATSSG